MNIDDGEAVALADGEVSPCHGPGDLEDTGAELGVERVFANDGNFGFRERRETSFPIKSL